MEFARPESLMLLWVVPLALVFFSFGAKRRQKRVALISGRSGGVRLSTSRTITKGILLESALVLLVIAYAGPRWGFDWQEVKRRGSDIVVAVDVSKSMLAEDINPSRLERAKREVADLLDTLKGDRVALVAFAGQSFVQCPLTEDYGAVRMFLNFLDTQLIPVQGTDLGKAIDESLKALTDGSPETSEGRAIILITDGEDQEGNAEKAADAAQKAGVKIFTVGIGSKEGAPIPEVGGGFKKDQAGNLVVTKPDENVLQKIALNSGGMFVRSVTGGMDLPRIYQEGIRQNVAQNEYKATRQKLWHDRFQWFLAAALLLLVLEFFVIDALPQTAAVALAMTLGAPAAHATTLRQAHRAYEENDYSTATQGFADEEKKSPDDAERSFFNLGNAQAGAGKLEDAIKAYESALAIDPKDKEAQENLEFVKKQKEQQQDQDKKDQDKKDQDKKDQDKKDQDQQKNQDQQKDDQQKQDQPKPDDQQKKDDEQKKDDQQKKDGEQKKDKQKKDEQAKQDQQKQDQQKQPENQEQQQASAQQKPQPMTQEEAEQLLRAVEDNAQKFMGQPKNGKAPPQQPSKDW